MRFIKSEDGENHSNYLARVVDVTEECFSPHPNPEVTRLKRCKIGEDTLYNVLVGINAQPGKYVFFPALSQINPEFLRFCNLYKNTEMNANPEEKPGMFEDNGRVKSIRLKGTVTVTNEDGSKTEKVLAGSVSEGFLTELDNILNFITGTLNIQCNKDDINPGIWFDTVEHNGKTFWLSKKYVCPSEKNIQNVKVYDSQHRYKSRQKKLNKINILLPNQFRFHYDTVLVQKNPFVIQPNDYIHISSKWHGSSFIVSNVLCRKPALTLKDKLIKLFTKKEQIDYTVLYASRTVIKNQYIIQGKLGNYKTGFYSSDIWKAAYDNIKNIIPKGYTIYGEIVGYTQTGSYIQKGYDYGCVQPGENEEYTPEKHFKLRIYRISITNPDGIVHEFSPTEVQTWCKDNNLIPVTELYKGKAKELYADIDENDPEWHTKFWEHMADDTNFFMEKNSPDCNNKVPHEGVVIKVNDNKARAFKLKCFKFISKEAEDLDNGVTNIEDDQINDISTNNE